jgi:hypothetical protein
MLMLEALQRIWEFLFGCWHGRLSRPFTISGDTYKVCLSCGRKLTYSLDTMSIIRRGTPQPPGIGTVRSLPLDN